MGIIMRLVIALIVICWGIWVVKTFSECKKNNISVKLKLKELWDTPFWIGSGKLSKVYDSISVYIGMLIFCFYFAIKLFDITQIKFPEILYNYSNSSFCLAVLIAYSFLLAKHSLRQRLAVAVYELIFFADIFLIEKNIWVNKSADFVVLFLLLLSATDIGAQKMLKISFSFSLLTYVVLFVLSSVGIIENGNMSAVETRGQESMWLATRHTFGFSHPNVAGTMLAVILVMWFIIRYKKIKWWDWLIEAIGAVILTIVIDSRGALMFLLAFLVLFVILQKFPGLFEKKLLGRVVVTFPVLFAAVSFALSLLFDPDIALFNKLDSISTGRLTLFSRALERFDFTLWGQITDDPGIPFIDNSFIRIYLQKGVIIFALMLLVYCILLYRLWKKKAAPETALVLSYMIYECIEGDLLLITLNISLYLIGSIIFLHPFGEQQLFCCNDELKEEKDV